MPIITALRALFTLLVAGFVALTATTVVGPPDGGIVLRQNEMTSERMLPTLTEKDPTEIPPPSSTAIQPEDPIAETLVAPVTPISIPRLSTSIIDTQTRGAVVHLLCTTRSSRSIRITTGSGVIIDPRGIVLTNAHVSQFWLLPEESQLGRTECRVRATIPIDREYRAEVLHFPTAWITAHAKNIDNKNPKGTGENDYALLRITKPVNATYVFPPVFPFVTYSVSDERIDEGDNILIAAYPATKDADSTSDLNSLSIVSTTARVESIFTFERTTLDLISLGASALSFKGSSGGAVMNDDNQLIGIITTSTDGASAMERELRAITLAHINRSLFAHTGESLAGLLSGNLETKAATFNTSVAPSLTEALLSEL
jgi:S1-C subfamily serine protease